MEKPLNAQQIPHTINNQQMNSESLQLLQQELTCSVCMSTFRHPVTIECGHSFCRSCLFNYIRTKNMCPICRTVLHHITDHPAEDAVLSGLEKFLKANQQIKKQRISMSQSQDKVRGQHQESQKMIKLQHYQNLLLIDIRCRDILLPYTKVMATFELQSPTLLSKLERFVARQERPFNRLGIVSKIVYINQLRYNVYECVIEGRAFCQIDNEEIEKKEDQNQQYFYRTCGAKIIYEDFQLNQQVYQAFSQKFMAIKNKQVVKTLSKSIEPQRIFSKDNPVATFYSIFRIIAETNEKKYEIITSFDQAKRQSFLKQFLQKLPQNVQENPSKFIQLKSQGGLSRELFFIVIVLFTFIFLFAFNSDYSQL